MSVKIEILDYKYDASNAIDWDNSVVGELDITDHSDFPLAMTFQISDFKDLTSTTGDYSKTFKIPATKNNNKIFKHLYNPNSISENKITDKKSCRILVNNLYSTVGLLKVNAVGGYGETPSYYDCVFFGSNLGWGAGLQDKYMDAINWGNDSKNLTYNKASIMATWQHADCDDASSASDAPIVYPITSYGVYNEGGKARTIQLLDTHYGHYGNVSSATLGYYGYNNSGNDYGTPLPSADWRPSVFVKSTLEKIFNGVGYKISSNFMNTDMFKKLVWLLPNFKYNNPDERYENFSVKSNFTNGVSMSATVYSGGTTSTVTEDGVLKSDYGGFVTYNDDNTAGGVPNYIGNPTPQGSGGTKLIPLDATRLNVTLDEGSYVDTTNDYITIGEYGYYDVKLNGLQARLANGRKGGGVVEEINTIKVCVNLDVQTVGQTSWVTLGRCADTQSPLNTAGLPKTDEDYSQFSSYQDLSSIDIKGTWLNKGDKIRLTAGLKITDTSDNGQNFMMTTFTRSASSSNLDITLKPEKVEYGQTYDLDKVMNKDYKQTDFVKGVAHAFNLQITTDEGTKTVNIEPFNSFYKPFSSAIDWTYKLDRSKEISDKWLENDLKRTLVFKYKSDGNDAKVKIRGEKYFSGIEDEFPYREILPDTFEKGNSTFENPFFAGTYNAKDTDTIQFFSSSNSSFNDTAFSACLWTEDVSSNAESRPDKGYEFLPRLLYWKKYSPNPSNTNSKRARVQTWSNTTKVVSAGVTGSSGLLSDIYPQATMINEDSTTSPVLSYGNVYVRDYDDVNKTYSSYIVGKGLYDTYYKDSIEMLKENPRMRTSYIALKISDIVNLDFTKLVYIDGAYWRINKIIDFIPNKNESTKVELIQFTQQSAFSGSAPMINSSGGLNNWQDVIADNDFDFGL